MADLVSTLTMSGRIGTRTISFTHQYTLEDVYDAGQRITEGPASINNYVTDGALDGQGPPTFIQFSPSYMMLVNEASSMPMTFQLNNNAGPKEVSLSVVPKGFVILCEPSTGGLFNRTAVANTSVLLDCDSVDPGLSAAMYTGIPSVLVAYNGAS